MAKTRFKVSIECDYYSGLFDIYTTRNGFTYSCIGGLGKGELEVIRAELDKFLKELK